MTAPVTKAGSNCKIYCQFFNHRRPKFKKRVEKTRRRIQQDGPMNSNDCNESYGVKFSSKENALIETACKEVEVHML